jgi:hypothetical protein
LPFWCDAKKQCFFDPPKFSYKYLKIGPLAPGGAPALSAARVQAIWPPRPGTIIKETGNKSDEQIRREIYHANGPVARRIFNYEKTKPI